MMRVVALAVWIATLGVVHSPSRAGCPVWTTYRGLTLHRLSHGSAYAYVTERMAIDADGAPNAYHPNDQGGLDLLANAGFPNGGWRSVLVPDPLNPRTPYVQTTGDFAGFYVSQTSLQDGTKRVTDFARYVDARQVPYIVFPGRFMRVTGSGKLGDIGMARNLSTGQTSALVLADVGELDQPLGEVSIRLAENLGGRDVNPRNGRGLPHGRFAYVIFPSSRGVPPWPVPIERLQGRADEEIAEVGGWQRILPCLEGD